jgi:hypothetical protein
LNQKITRENRLEGSVRVNVFAGGRRIAVVLALLLAIATTAFAFIANDPGPSATYAVHADGSYSVATECNFVNDATTPAEAGHLLGLVPIEVRLCFKGTPDANGRMSIPYRASDGTTWLNVEYDPAVQAYIKKYTAEFHPPQDGLDNLRNSAWHGLYLQSRYALGTFLATCAVVWIVSSVIGWIVRGFLGVPRGKDFPTQ